MPHHDRSPVARLTLAAAGSLAMVSSAAHAQNAPGSAPPVSGEQSVQQQMDLMRSELDRMARDNKAMKSEIDQLKAEADDQWLTQERSDQIRGLVQDVLADADTRASLQDSGLTAGWNGHFFLASSDGRFLLQFEGLQQIRFIWNTHDPVSQPPSNYNNDRYRYGFENARTELTFRGHVFSDDVEYMIRGDFARSGGQFTLEDAWVRYHLNDKFAVRFGQYKLPFSREYLIADSALQTVERSLVNLFFTPKYGQGIELEYHDTANRFAISFEDNNSFVGDGGPNTTWSAQDNEWAFTTRYERLVAGTWEQFSQFTSLPEDEFGMMFGLGFGGEQGESTGTPTLERDESRLLQATADLSVQWGGANMFASAYYAYFDTPQQIFNFWGFTLQGGVYVAPKWELFARAEFLFLEENFSALPNDLIVGTVGVNYYIDGQDLKLTTDLSYGFNEIDSPYAADIAGFRGDAPGANPQIVWRTQFQLMF